MKEMPQLPKNSLGLMPPKGLFRRLKGLFKFLVILTILLGIVFWLRSDFWQVKRIDCRLNAHPCSQQLWAELMNKSSGKNILLLSSTKLAEYLKQNHPEFLEVKIFKKLPDGLLAKIELRLALAAINKDEDYFIIDKDGILLEKVQTAPNLPLVMVESQIEQTVGTKIDQETILKMIQILNESKLRLIEPKSIKKISERAIEMWLEDNIKVLLSAQKEIRPQLDSLQFILERTKIEGSKPSQIDLRFEKPVIVK